MKIITGLKKVDWAKTLSNKTTIVALVAGLLLLVQQVLAMFGVTWDYSTLLTQITGVVGTIFTLLTLLGIVVNPTTEGIGEKND